MKICMYILLLSASLVVTGGGDCRLVSSVDCSGTHSLFVLAGKFRLMKRSTYIRCPVTIKLKFFYLNPLHTASFYDALNSHHIYSIQIDDFSCSAFKLIIFSEITVSQ